MGRNFGAILLALLVSSVSLARPALADGPYCPRDRESDCPRTGLASGCCWDMHFNFESDSDPDFVLGDIDHVPENFAPFGIMIGRILMPNLRTGRFDLAIGNTPRVARGIPSGQLLEQDACNSFAFSFRPDLKVFRVQFTLKGMSGQRPIDVRTDTQYRDDYSRIYWHRIENPGAAPAPPLPAINEVITVGLADGAAEASNGNSLLGLRISFDPETCRSLRQPQPAAPPFPNRILEPPPPIRIDDLYVWALAPPDAAVNSVRALAVEATQSVSPRPTRIADPSAPAAPDTRLMIEGDSLRVLPFIASKDLLVRFYLGARREPRLFTPQFQIKIFNHDGSVDDIVADWEDAPPDPFGTVRELTQVPHIPVTATEADIDQALFRMRAGTPNQGIAELFIPPRFLRDAANAQIDLHDAEDPGGDALGKVSVKFEPPVSLGLNVVQIARADPPDGYFDEEYEITEGFLRTFLRWTLPVSEPVKLNRLPDVVDLRPHPSDCAAFLADRAALFAGVTPVADTDWTSYLAVEVVPGGIAGFAPCEFAAATQGPGVIPLVVTNTPHPTKVAQGIAWNIGLVEICASRFWATPGCEASWPYIEGGFGNPDDTAPSQKWGNLGHRIVRDLAFIWDDEPRGLITVNPISPDINNACIVTRSIVPGFPYCTEAQGTGFNADDFYVRDLMTWVTPNWVSDITYYRLYQCLAHGQCFDPPLHSLPDYGAAALAGELPEGLDGGHRLAWQQIMRRALERAKFVKSLRSKDGKDTAKPIATTVSESDFPDHPGGKRVKALMISGAIAADGTVRDVKVLAKSLPAKQLKVSPKGRHGLELYTDRGLAGVIGFEPYAVSGRNAPGFAFNVAAPYTNGLVKLVLRKDGKVLFAKGTRPAKLDVVLEDPQGLNKGSTVLRWKVVGDLSKAAEQVIEFSPDGGGTWHPIAALTAGPRKFAIKPGTLPVGKRARFAVSVSDGLAAARAESQAAP